MNDFEMRQELTVVDAETAVEMMKLIEDLADGPVELVRYLRSEVESWRGIEGLFRFEDLTRKSALAEAFGLEESFEDEPYDPTPEEVRMLQEAFAIPEKKPISPSFLKDYMDSIQRLAEEQEHYVQLVQALVVRVMDNAVEALFASKGTRNVALGELYAARERVMAAQDDLGEDDRLTASMNALLGMIDALEAIED